jgi:ribosome-binding factor A
MESKRQQKFARLIQKDLSEIFQRDAKSLFGGAFITVTDIKVSPDLGLAKVYLSFMLAKDKTGLLENIKEKSKSIRQMLASKIRNQVRVIPELAFYLDDTIEHATKMDALIANLHIPPATGEDEDNGKTK